MIDFYRLKPGDQLFSREEPSLLYEVLSLREESEIAIVHYTGGLFSVKGPLHRARLEQLHRKGKK